MRYLVIQTAFLGDFVLTTPVIKKLMEVGDVMVIARPFAREIFPAIEFDKRRKFINFFKVLKKAIDFSADVVVSPHGSATSSILSLFSAKRRVGFYENSLSFIYNYRVKKEEGEEHEILKIIKILRPLGLEVQPKPFLPYTPQDVERVILERKGNRKVIVFAPFSIWHTKTYIFWKDFVSKIPRDYFLVIVGTEEERKRYFDLEAEKIISDGEARGDILNLVGKTNIRELISVVRISDIFVGADNGVGHIASAFEKFCISIFGPTSKKFGFYPFTHHIIVEKNLPCRPCSKHGSRKCPIGTHECMKIKGEEIIKIVEKMKKIE